MTWEDGAALGFFLVGWWFLGWLIDSSPWHKFTLSAAMKAQRQEWMRQMAAREIRLIARDFSTLPVAARTLVKHLHSPSAPPEQLAA